MSEIMETRHYPTGCLSMYCGGGGDDCKTCYNREKLEDFKAWVKAHDAVCKDETWAPTIYVARR